MPRYFFHVLDPGYTVDEEGRELPDLEAARALALESARDLVCVDVKNGWLNLDHSIEVRDERGDTVLIVSFREAFQVAGRGAWPGG
jgi:hypothetical protein